MCVYVFGVSLLRGLFQVFVQPQVYQICELPRSRFVEVYSISVEELPLISEVVPRVNKSDPGRVA